MRLKFQFGGPIHYLGNRMTRLPDSTGKMSPDRMWLNRMVSLIQSNEMKVKRIIEPFSGSASFSLGMMEMGVAEQYLINDTNTALIECLKLIKDEPSVLVQKYSELEKEFVRSDEKQVFFQSLIDIYNQMDFYDRALILPFIVNHLWGGIIVTNKDQDIIFTPPENSEGIILSPLLNADNFQHEVMTANQLMCRYQIKLLNGDFEQAISAVNGDDFVMMNPPYPENMRNEDSGMFVEIHKPNVLHQKIISAINKLEAENTFYAMTYGFYNPDYSNFVLNQENIQSFLYILGSKDCAFGEALDQIYFSSNLKLNDELIKVFIPTNKVLTQKLSQEDALIHYRRIAS